MNIAHVIGDLGAGGIQRLLLDLLSTPSVPRHQQTVVSISGASGPLREAYDRAGIRVVSCPVLWPNRLPLPSYRLARQIRKLLACTFSWRLQRTLRQIRADLVHTHLSHRLDCQARAARNLDLPWLWTLHGQYRPKDAEFVRWLRALRTVKPERYAITAVSSVVARDMAQRLALKEGSIHVVHSGTVGTVQRPLDPTRTARVLGGFGPEDIVFGSVGRLVWEKAYDVFIDAAAHMRARAPKARFVIAGEGRDRAALQSRIDAAGLKDVCRLVGFVGDVPSFLSGLNVFVLPSRSEGFGIALVEALAAGVPCIGSEIGGITDILDDGAGLLVPADAPLALAEGMVRLMDPQLRTDLSRRGPGVASRFTVHGTAAKFDRLYQALAPRCHG